MSRLDTSYFSQKLALIVRDLSHYTPQEMARELVRLAKVADEAEAVKEAQPPQAQQAAEAVPSDDDMILIPRGLVGAACSAIDKKRDAPEVLKKLRRYTTGDLSAPQTQQVAEAVPFGWVQFIDGVQTQNFFRDEAALKQGESITKVCLESRHKVEYVQVFALQPAAQAAPASQVRDEKSEFEQWLFNNAPKSTYVHSAWDAWQARAALAHKPASGEA